MVPAMTCDAFGAPVQVLPRFGMLLADWQPLQHPQSTVVLADFAAWRPLLESEAQRDNIFQVQLPCPEMPRCLQSLLHSDHRVPCSPAAYANVC